MFDTQEEIHSNYKSGTKQIQHCRNGISAWSPLKRHSIHQRKIFCGSIKRQVNFHIHFKTAGVNYKILMRGSAQDLTKNLFYK